MPTLPNLQKVSITFSTFTSRDSDTLLHVFIKNRSSDTSWVDGATDFISNQLAYDDFVSQGLFCRNPCLAVFEAVAGGVGFPAGSLSEEYFLNLSSNDISCGEIVLPVVNIHILPNGNNTWQFNYIVKFYFADPAYDFSFSSIEMGVPGISLSEANRNYVGIGNENPNAVVAPVKESGMDFTLTQVALQFNTESGSKMAGTQLNVQVVNRISSNNTTAIGSVADLFSDMEVGKALQSFSNSLTPTSGLASPQIGLQAMVLPLVNISIDPPNSQQGAWIFDFRVQYYFGTETYPRALMFESTTSGIYLDSTYTSYNCVYMGDSFPTVAPAAAPLAALSPVDHVTTPKPIPFSLLEKKLAEFINSRQGLDPSSPSPTIARIRLDNQGKFSQASTTPANYYDLQIIEANPLTPGSVPPPNYSEAVTWGHSPNDLGVGAYETYFSNFNSQSINLTFDPTQITPFTLTIVFDTSGNGGTITTSAPVVGGTYTPTEFSITIKLTLTVAPHPIYPDSNRIDFLSWITDLNNLVFLPPGGLTGTFLGQPVALQAPNRAEGIGTLLDEGVMLVKLTIPGHTAPGGTIRPEYPRHLMVHTLPTRSDHRSEHCRHSQFPTQLMALRWNHRSTGSRRAAHSQHLPGAER